MLMVMQILSERLALWFLRLNGFLTIPNFIVHPEGPREQDGAYPQQTDVDVLGVRFPFRAENRERPMSDFPLFIAENRPMVVLSEVKTERCGLNGPWTDANRENIQKVLFAGGFRPAEQANAIAGQLYNTGVWEDGSLIIRIVCFGSRPNLGLRRAFPDVPQLLWTDDVLPFIYKRFNQYKQEKRMHHQWDDDAKQLFAEAEKSPGNDGGQFFESVEVVSQLL
jgi:hypothetical protein